MTVVIVVTIKNIILLQQPDWMLAATITYAYTGIAYTTVHREDFQKSLAQTLRSVESHRDVTFDRSKKDPTRVLSIKMYRSTTTTTVYYYYYLLQSRLTGKP